MSNLTAKQRRLVEAYADPKCESKTQAGRKAGYNHESSTHRELAKPAIMEEVAKLRLEQAELASSSGQLDKTKELEQQLLEARAGLAQVKLEQAKPQVIDHAEVRADWIRLVEYVHKLGRAGVPLDVDSIEDWAVTTTYGSPHPVATSQAEKG